VIAVQHAVKAFWTVAYLKQTEYLVPLHFYKIMQCTLLTFVFFWLIELQIAAAFFLDLNIVGLLAILEKNSPIIWESNRVATMFFTFSF